MGEYVNKNLTPNETVVSEAKLHWIIFLKPILFFLFALFLMNSISNLFGFFKLLLIIISIIFFLIKFIEYKSTEIALTNNRIIVKTGFISRSGSDILLKKVEGIDIKQSVLGRLFNYGSMIVRGTGSGGVWYRNIANPYDFQIALNNTIGEN